MLDQLLEFYLSPGALWFVLELFLVIVLIFLLRNKGSSLYIFFEIIYEKVYDFFGDIIGGSWKEIIKTYVVILFFTILLSNLIWIFLELLAPIFWADEAWHFILEYYIIIPSADINFNLALAIISILIMLYVQFWSLWFKNFLHDYFPVFWKNYITVERWNKGDLIYYPLKVIVKIFDITISMFLGLLEIIWLIAKVISLSFRLFGNMTSGTILLGMAVLWVASMTKWVLWFEFPVILPVFVYLQEILVALIQAVVFPLLVTIFIKMSMVDSEA